MTKTVFAWMAAGWLIVAGGAASGQDVRVVKSTDGKAGIDWAGFAAGAEASEALFMRTVKADVVRSGWFVLSAAGGGEFRVSGAAEMRRGRLEVKVQVLQASTARTVLGKAWSAEEKDVRKLAHTVADAIVEAVTGRKGFASSRLLLVGNRTGRKELYLCDADGSSMVQLTQDKSISLDPQWNPDGRQVLYTSYLKRAPDLMLIDLPTGNRRRIAQYPGLNTGGVYSPDGRSIAMVLSKDGNPEIYIQDVASGRLTRLTNTPRAAEASPSWSPDGRRMVYVSDVAGSPQLYIVSRDGGAPRRLTSLGSENVSPDWGSNGKIACASRQGGRYRIVVIDPDSGQADTLALDGADYEDPSWARDGRHLACARTERYRAAIYLIDILGDKPIPLLAHDGDWFSPSWEP